MNELNKELETFLEEIVDLEKKESVFENHMDTNACDFLQNCNIENTSNEIAQNTISSINELKKQGFL